MSFKNRFACYVIMILNYLIIFNCQAAEGTIILNSQMPTKAVSAIATQSVVLKSGFHAVGSTGAFNAKIGNVNSVYPLVQLADGSTTLQLPEANEYASIGRNCTKTIIPRKETNNNSQLTVENSLIVEEYSDGLGQTSMRVQKSITPEKKDLATVANYDCFGQVTNQWLPTPIDGISSDPGFVIQQAQNFYADSKPYTTSATINSTDNIDGVSICKPGDAWHSGTKTMKNELLASNFTDPELIIRQYSVVDDKVVLTDDPAEFFSVAVLKTSDEDGKVKYQFGDAFGRTLLERQINDGQNHDTYYIYDNIGHLRFVLSPEAAVRMSIAGDYILGTAINGDNDPLAQYAYVYKYDAHGRCIAKKLPGRDWNKMIYDQADHLVFSQDGNQRAIDQWTYYKYDALDRLVQSGTTALTSTAANTIKTYYKNATAVEAYKTGQGYSSNSQLGSNSVLLTQNFYDNYDYLNLTAYSALKTNLLYKDYNNDAALNGFDLKYENLAEGVDIATQGMLTGTSVAMLDNSITLVNAMYYNDRGQVVQTRANNHLNGYDNEFFHYNFSGQILNKRHVHKTEFIPVELTENYRMQYDNAGRLISLRHALNTQNEILMDSLIYDETGRVKQKILHGGIQHVNFAYNIQNQLKSINSESFTETLYYNDSPYGNASYNGNISAQIFGTGYDKFYLFSYDQLNRLKGATNGYGEYFTEKVESYDKNGNLQKIKRNGYIYDYYGSNVTPGTIDDLNITYNGNQLKNVSDAVDQSKVFTTIDFMDKQDAQNSVEYLYDKNGNQTADLNKGIAWIRYNLLNLPQKVQFSNGKKNEYLYDAAGVKHRAGYNYSTNSALIPLGDTDPQKENSNLSTFQIDYCGNYVYEKTSVNGNPVLKRIVTPEGYISTFSATPMSYIGNWRAIYCLKDHQENTRLKLTSDYLSNNTSKVYNASNQIDYYPFGMERSNTGQTSGGPLNSETIPYLYSGKEIDRINGLNEYDFGARWLDNAVPGFTTPDPLAENHYSESPYAYCGANPVNRVDPTGMDYSYTENGGVVVVGTYNYDKRMALLGTYGFSAPLHSDPNSHSLTIGEQLDINRPRVETARIDYQSTISDGGDNSISKLTTALSGINGMLGFANSQKEFVWSKLANSERNSIAYNIQKGLKASGERVLTSEIKAGIKAGFKSTNVKLGAASVILIAANVVINEEIRPSDVMNTVMTGIAMTGWGAPIAAGYFIIDVGVSALNDGHGVSDLIDDQFGPIYDFKK